MKAFVAALVVALGLGAVAYVVSSNAQVERPVAGAFSTQGVRL